jgi:hypothetical protein
MDAVTLREPGIASWINWLNVHTDTPGNTGRHSLIQVGAYPAAVDLLTYIRIRLYLRRI